MLLFNPKEVWDALQNQISKEVIGQQVQSETVPLCNEIRRRRHAKSYKNAHRNLQ